jgi:hypothetical protein
VKIKQTQHKRKAKISSINYRPAAMNSRQSEIDAYAIPLCVSAACSIVLRERRKSNKERKTFLRMTWPCHAPVHGRRQRHGCNRQVLASDRTSHVAGCCSVMLPPIRTGGTGTGTWRCLTLRRHYCSRSIHSAHSTATLRRPQG